MYTICYLPHFSPRGGHRYGGSNLSGRPSKGDAFAIAFAYQRKKRQEELMREEEVRKAKKVTRMLNEPDSKSATAKSVVSLRVRGCTCLFLVACYSIYSVTNLLNDVYWCRV